MGDGHMQKNQPDSELKRNGAHRERKRTLYNTIRQQMEFYFGDANLSRDHFLQGVINNDPNVPLEMFLKFNKIKKLTDNVKDIAKAVSSSDLIEVNETANTIRRKKPMPLARNADYLTLYVEVLPSYADQDWVRSVFERFGPIDYVSLPRYSHSKETKQFAFVEFAHPDGVEKALKVFGKLNNVLSYASDPSELYSAKAFEKEKQQRKFRAAVSNSEQSMILASIEKNEDNTSKNILKRKLASFDECSDVKYIKNEEGESIKISIDTSEFEPSEDEEIPEVISEPFNSLPALSGEEAGEKPITNHKGRHQRRHKQKKCKVYDLQPDHLQLRVASNFEWKRLRSQYFDLQKQAYSDFKRLRRLQRVQLYSQPQRQELNKKESTIGASDECQSVLKANIITKDSASNDVQQMNMNFYGAGDGEADDTGPRNIPAFKSQGQTKHGEAMPKDFERRLIIKMNLLEPCVCVKEFKADMSQFPAIKYVDIKEGSMQAYLRCESAAAAGDIIRKLNSPELICSLLANEEEDLYWQKLQQQREANLNKKEKKQHRRNRQQLKEKVASHVYFANDDEDVDHETRADGDSQ